ncbi:hypothetical protein CR513_47133, partial [Mucuna pruriens]
MKHMFLEKFFPASRTTTIRKEICNTLARHYMNIGKGSTSFVPHIHITRSTSSLMMMDRSMIDTASGGTLMDKMPTAARHLISNMASNMH